MESSSHVIQQESHRGTYRVSILNSTIVSVDAACPPNPFDYDIGHYAAPWISHNSTPNTVRPINPINLKFHPEVRDTD